MPRPSYAVQYNKMNVYLSRISMAEFPTATSHQLWEYLSTLTSHLGQLSLLTLVGR